MRKQNSKKSIVVVILLLAVILTGAFLSYGIAIAVPQHNEMERNTNVHARILFVDSPDLVWEPKELEELAQREMVQLVCTQDEWNCGHHIRTIEGDEVGLSFMGTVDSMRPSAILCGKGAGLEEFELLIPSRIVMDDGVVRDGKEFLGQTFTLELDSPEFKSREEAENWMPSEEEQYTRYFTVVGVYDVTKVAYMENQCFTTMQTVKELSEISKGNYYDFMIENSPMYKPVVVLAESYQAAQLLELQLNAEGYHADIAYFVDSVYQAKMMFVNASIFVLLTGLGFCIVFLFVKHRMLSGSEILSQAVEKMLLESMAKQCIGLFISATVLALIGYGFLYPFIMKELLDISYIPVFSDYFIFGVAGVLILNLIVLFLFLRTIQISWLKARVEYHDKLLKEQQNYHKNLAVYHQRVRQLHHDMNNHFLILYHALRNHEIPSALAYTEKQLQLLSDNKMTYTGYLLLDTILDYKKQFANLQQTEYLIHNQLETALALSEELQQNLSMMMASCIDNALEATAQIHNQNDRWIRITLKNDTRYLYCKIENSVRQNISLAEGKLPGTTKEDTFCHGLGLFHVKQLAEKHQGYLSLSCKDHVFTAGFMVVWQNG